jgi:hypothetical protein
MKAAYLAQFHKFQQNREKYFAPKLAAALREQYNQYLRTKDLSRISIEPIHSVLKKLYIDAGVHWGSLVYSQLPKKPVKVKRRAPIGFNEEMVAMINSYFAGDILNTSAGITDTTRNLIRVVLQIANEEGRGFDWITTQLTTESRDLTRNRSRLIARTETVTATNQAAFFAAAKTGLLMTKEWLSAGDNRVRLDHQMINGRIIGMTDYFNVGGSQMLLPGAKVQENGLETPAKEVCNCRCVCLFKPQRNHSGRLMEFDYGLFHNLQ